MSLISVAELADRLADPASRSGTVICDVRYYLADHDQGRREYEAGHIPGARFVDLERQLAGGAGGGRHPLPDVERFTTVLGGLGITPATLVVAYDSAGGGVASRLWWMLRSIGHGQVAVLDGGLPAWVAAGHPLTTDVELFGTTEYPPVGGWTDIVDADAVAEGIAFGATVVDARAPERYRGDVEPIDSRAGHIPGAINRFHGDNLAPDGTHRPLGELAERLAGVGESPIVYCGSGVTACHALLAMSLVGITRARLYPGSWSDWSGDPDRPIATGDE
jgi:thiosulfate/3-mercaptopyruvate sulfurtransferase